MKRNETPSNTTKMITHSGSGKIFSLRVTTTIGSRFNNDCFDGLANQLGATIEVYDAKCLERVPESVHNEMPLFVRLKGKSEFN